INLTTGQTKAADVIIITEAGTPTENRIVKAQAFTYQLAVLTPVIRTLQPTSGPVGGGTRVTIIGDAFQQPVQVFFGSAEAQVISVSGSEVVAISNGVQLTGCGDVSAATTVTNTDNGDTAVGPTFTFRVPRPLITAISNPNTLGGTATITVFNALGFARITIGGVSAPVTGSTVN